MKGKKNIYNNNNNNNHNHNNNGFHSNNNSIILFLLGSMALFIIFLLYRKSDSNIIVIQSPPSTGLGRTETGRTETGITETGRKEDTLTNAYIPPLRNNMDFRPSTQTQYQQIGILTRNNNEILPLMGKRKNTSRYKWQYYTMVSGVNGNLQTKLPISVKGKSCTGEYGCDEIYNNDTVYVEGYKDVFVATIYENNTFEYVI
jgi:hypothetical protein